MSVENISLEIVTPPSDTQPQQYDYLPSCCLSSTEKIEKFNQWTMPPPSTPPVVVTGAVCNIWNGEEFLMKRPTQSLLRDQIVA